MTQILETAPNIKYQELLIDGQPGFGFGEGTISYNNQLATRELTAETAKYAKKHIESDDAYSDIDKIDDTCVDGRVSVLTTKRLSDGTVFETDISYVRAKIPGGGQQMVTAGMIGLGIIEQDALLQARTAILFMQTHNIKFGSHTDTSASGENCGCGAIDKFPIITENVLKYQNQIANVINEIYSQVYNLKPNIDILNQVYYGYEEIVTNPLFFKDYSGKKISQAVQQSGAVVKKLSDKHKEDYIVLNFIPGTTLNQRKLVEYTKNTVQSFCVDVWRMQELAVALNLGSEKETTQAFYSMLVYGLATFATLTDGSLPVIVRS